MAAVVALAGIGIELAPESRVEHPFATRDLHAGDRADESVLEWRSIPDGLLPPLSLPFVAGRTVLAGEPLLPSAMQSAGAIPAGWWALELSAPEGSAPGREVQVVVAPAGPGDPIQQVPGVIVSLAAGDGFSPLQALVAVPGETAGAVAVAAGEGRITVLLRA